MKINNLGYVNSASLFSKNPCTVVEIILDKNEKLIMNNLENSVKSKIEGFINTIPNNSDLFFLNLARLFIDDILITNKSILAESKIIKINDEKYNLIVEDINFHLTYFLVDSIIKILVLLYNNVEINEILNKFNNLKYIIQKNSKSKFTTIIEHILIKNSINYIPNLTTNTEEMQIGFGIYQNIIDGAKSFNSSHSGINISLSKIQTNHFLLQYAFPMTKQFQIRNINETLLQAKELGFPVVLKSDYGAFGSKVYPDLRTEEQVTQAFNIIQNDIIRNNMNGRNILIEEFIEGNDYRILIANNKLYSVYHRIPAQIKGNGINTIIELIKIENEQREKSNKNNSYNPLPLLKLDEAEIFTLSKQNLIVDSIPKKNQIVFLRSNANQSSGGTIEVVTDKIHPDNVELAIEIAKIMKIDIIGIDVIIDNISNSYKDGKLRILEVNHTPAIEHWAFGNGQYEKNLLEILAPKYNNQIFPIIVIPKNNYSLYLSTCLNNFFVQNNFKVGMINKTGMYINKELYALTKDINYNNPALHLLRNPNINLAITERDTTNILDFGIGTGNSTISIILDCSDKIVKTRLYKEGISQIEATKLLLENTLDTSIILIDNPLLCDLSKKIPKDKIILLCTNKENKEFDYFIENNYNLVYLDKENDSKVDFLINYKNEEKSFSIEVEEQNQEIILSLMTQIALSLKFKLF